MISLRFVDCHSGHAPTANNNRRVNGRSFVNNGILRMTMSPFPDLVIIVVSITSLAIRLTIRRVPLHKRG